MLIFSYKGPYGLSLIWPERSQDKMYYVVFEATHFNAICTRIDVHFLVFSLNMNKSFNHKTGEAQVLIQFTRGVA